MRGNCYWLIVIGEADGAGLRRDSSRGGAAGEGTDRRWQGTIANILSVIFQFKMKRKLIFFWRMDALGLRVRANLPSRPEVEPRWIQVAGTL